MEGFLILVVVFGLGVGAGYGWREIISRRRRRIARSQRPAAEVPPDEPVGAGAGRDDAIDLDGLLVAANDDRSGLRQPPRGSQHPDQTRQADDFDGAVRNLLGELNRRPPAQSSASRRRSP